METWEQARQPGARVRLHLAPGYRLLEFEQRSRQASEGQANALAVTSFREIEASGKEVQHPDKDRTLFRNDKEGFAVWRNKSYPDRSTAFHPEDVDRFNKTWGLE